MATLCRCHTTSGDELPVAVTNGVGMPIMPDKRYARPMATKKPRAKQAASKRSPAKKKPPKKSPAKKTPTAKAPIRKAPTKKKVAKKPATKKPATNKTAAKKQPTKKTATKKTAAKRTPAHKPIRRRDATGHLDPAYERDLLRNSRENRAHDDDRAFLVGKNADDAYAEEMGREFVETVTSGEDQGTELRDTFLDEEIGGPFVNTTRGQEVADEPDASNPKGATREPFPKT